MEGEKEISTNGSNEQREHMKVVRYKECLKNHAAALGGNATDGCGEFMPSGEHGTIEALKCSACNCHRNFHKKEMDGEPSMLINAISPPINHLISRALPNQQMIVSYGTSSVPSQSDDDDAMGAREVEKPKKRFRTRFTEEQKQKMLGFADKVGWKMQKLDDSVVQQFCQEIGIRRRVLKVWMHNNKHHYLQRNTHQSVAN